MRMYSLFSFLFCVLFSAATLLEAGSASTGGEWIELFDGRSLDGWKASEHSDTWKVADGILSAAGPRSHLFYTGAVQNHDFRNFELSVVMKAAASSNSGVYLCTRHHESGWPKQGYEIQVNNSYNGEGNYRELKRTGSLYGIRNIYKSFIHDNGWFQIRARLAAGHLQVWTNDLLTVDYRLPEKDANGTIALQAHDPHSRVWVRSVKIKPLPDTVQAKEHPSIERYGITPKTMDRIHGASVPFIDYHIHLRGGMSVDKALKRQAITGINCGVLKNIGKGWPIETDAQLEAFLDDVADKPLFAGLQVNDRNWMDHDPHLLSQLDYILADTMIMPMPTDADPPVKLWMTDGYKIDDPELWMERYMKHNLRVLKEPVTILANPTYLPPPVADKYDTLWTDERMKTIIQAAVDNNVALEINARSGLPHERFIRLAKAMGAKFTFGTNNFKSDPISMKRCVDAIEKYGLAKNDMYVPETNAFARKLAAYHRSSAFSWKKTTTSLALLNKGTMVWNHVHDKSVGKPFMRFGLPDGTELTRPWPFPKDYPKADHVWHRSLWWSWKKINGVNFWEQHQKGTEPLKVDITKNDDGSAVITLQISYHEPEKKPVVYETRVVTVSAPDTRGCYLITWDATFRPAGREKVVFDKNSYGGMALRMAAECCGKSGGGTDPWTFFDSEGQKDSNNKRARWIGYRGKTRKRKPAAIVMFDHPQNPRHPSYWQTRTQYPYMNPSLTCREDFVLAAGKTLRLIYGVYVHDGPLDTQQAEKAWQQFARQSRTKAAATN